MEKGYYSIYESPIFPIIIGATDKGISKIEFINKHELSLMMLDKEYDGYENKETDMIKECKKQLKEYFCDERKDFTIPLDIIGTPFQRSVWEQLRKIKYGTTATYGEIASMIGNPKASRAVGGANNKNPISIIIPCHRIIGKGGDLVGYGGGLDIKKRLLQIEGVLDYKD